MKHLFIKIGGSLITDKRRSFTPRHDILQKLSLEVTDIQESFGDYELIIAHGSGSFGHHAAKMRPDDLEYIQVCASKFHSIVQEYFSFPLLYGQVIDTQIVSSETLLLREFQKLTDLQKRESIVLFLTDVNGVEDSFGKVYSTITAADFADIRSHIHDISQHDVTGGMQHKIDMALQFSRQDATVYIANGKTPDIIRSIVEQKDVVCTKVVF